MKIFLASVAIIAGAIGYVFTFASDNRQLANNNAGDIKALKVEIAAVKENTEETLETTQEIRDALLQAGVIKPASKK